MSSVERIENANRPMQITAYVFDAISKSMFFRMSKGNQILYGSILVEERTGKKNKPVTVSITVEKNILAKVLNVFKLLLTLLINFSSSVKCSSNSFIRKWIFVENMNKVKWRPPTTIIPFFRGEKIITKWKQWMMCYFVTDSTGSRIYHFVECFTTQNFPDEKYIVNTKKYYENHWSIHSINFRRALTWGYSQVNKHFQHKSNKIYGFY